MTNARTVKSAREKAAEMRAEAARKEARRRSVLIAIVVAVVLVVAVGVTVIVRQAQHDRAVAAALTPSGTPKNVESNFGIATGPATTTGGKPRVVVDMYEDFQCPICRQFESTDGATLKAWQQQGIVQLVYHPVAFLDQASSTDYSTRSLMAAASVQDSSPTAFQAFHDLLYANQPAEGSAGLPDSQLADLAAQAGGHAGDGRLGPRLAAVQGLDGQGDRRLLPEVHRHPDRPRRGDTAEGARRGVAEEGGGRGRGGEGPAGSEVTARQSSVSVRVRAATSVARRRASATPRSPSARWMAITARTSPSARSRVTQGSPPPKRTATICAHSSSVTPHHVPDDEAVGAGRRAQPREQQQDIGDDAGQQHDPEPVVPAPRDGHVARRQHGEPEQDNGLGHGERDRHPASPERPERDGTAPPSVRPSQPARVDVGDEDRAGAEVVELVHDLVRPAARHHGPHGDPAAVVQRRDRRATPGRA